MNAIKKTILLFILSIALLLIAGCSAKSASFNEDVDAVYFGSLDCPSCIKIQDSGLLEQLETDGFKLKIYLSGQDDGILSLIKDFYYTYNLPLDRILIPILFVGNSYFIGAEEIANAITSGDAQLIMNEQNLPEILQNPN